ncbi:MAG: hypothetical protein IJK36_09555 [Bacteroidales bacterium]|nr:hypothetical protein [Bacteroidales bacterium]
MGFAIQLKNGNDVAMRFYPDIHVKGGNINLARARELDPTVAELTLENAGALVDKAGVTVRAKAECEQKFTDLLLSMGASVQRKEVVEKAKVTRTDGSAPITPTGSGTSTPSGTGTGTDTGSGSGSGSGSTGGNGGTTGGNEEG